MPILELTLKFLFKKKISAVTKQKLLYELVLLLVLS